MSDRRRRPGNRGALLLLLLGVICLGAGVLLHLYGSDDRGIVARDVGALPGSTANRSRPLAEDIPVLSGLDELSARPGPAPDAGVPGLSGGFDPAGAADTAVPDDGPGSGDAAAPGDTGGPAAADSPAGTDPSASPQASGVESGALADPPPRPVPRRPAPRPLPQPPAPLGPDLPGLVGPIYPLPEPDDTRPARTPVVPAVLELPARGVTAPVDAVGTDPSGGMVIPEQVRTVGWWAPGVLPGGSAGSAVISGHVDSRTQGVGVLSVLPQLAEGEPVLVRDAGGRTAAFRVAARREYGKYDLPRAVFSREGTPQLVLITCGGRFDPAARSYESNIVVYAVPDPDAPPQTRAAAPGAPAPPP